MSKELLDKKDKQILSLIDLEARIPVSEISRKVKIPKHVVLYRIKRMESRGIIEGYYPLINVFKLGKNYIRFWLKYVSMPLEKEKEIRQFLGQHKDVAWVGLLEGKWNIVAVILSESLDEFLKFKKEILDRYGKFISRTDSSLAIRVSQFPNNYLYPEQISSEKQMQVTGDIITLDKTDIGLLGLLKNDCRQSLVSLGEKLSLSANAINYRIKSLEKNNILLAYCTKINYSILGYMYFKVFFKYHTYEKDEIKRFEKEVSQSRVCLYTVAAVGEFDFEAELLFKAHSEYYLFMKDLRNRYMQLLMDYEYYLVYDVPKISY